MSMPAYGRYRESSVGWLGLVPTHWTDTRLRFVARLNPSKSEVAHRARDEEVSFVPMDAVGEDGSLRLNQCRVIGDVETGYTFFRDGDVTVAKITPCFENGKGAIMRGLVGGIGFGTTELIVARPLPGNSPDFLHWLFNSTAFRKVGEGAMYGAGGQKGVPEDFVRDFALALPTPSEQSAIAAFLDRETDKIDALVEAQRRLIELLKEKRQAVISHAVTKGLDPAAPLKDSGVEWLGEVPAHWSLTTVGRVCDALSYGFTNPMPTADEGPYMLTANDIGDGRINFETARRTTWEAYQALTAKSRPQSGDILLTKDGTLGRIAVHDGQDACINQSVAFLRTVRSIVSPEFLAPALSSGVYQDRMIFEAGGTTIKHIYISRLAKMALAVPPLQEMAEIAAWCERALANADQLIEAALRGIELLGERRSALISAAVTGKIDVRGLVLDQAEAA